MHIIILSLKAVSAYGKKAVQIIKKYIKGKILLSSQILVLLLKVATMSNFFVFLSRKYQSE